MLEESYSNIRHILAPFIGKRLEDISQQDKEEFAETKESYVCLMFEGGLVLTFPTTEAGFHVEGMEEDAL